MTVAEYVLRCALGAGIGVIAACTPTESQPRANAFSSSAACRECHRELYEEWESSFHGQAFLDPLVRAKEQANNFRKPQCIPCHAPAPVLEHGIGKGARVVERVSHRELGVDCLSCHRVGGDIAGTRDLPADQAPCRPRAVPELSQVALCAPCHNQHETVTEWEASAFAARDTDCLDCHMPEVTRGLADGSTKTGRSHRFPGGHDLQTLLHCFDLTATSRIEADGTGTLEVSISNTGAGHNLPTDARHRALDLVVTLEGEDGVKLPPRDTGRPFGCERGTERRRFRNPYRSEPTRAENLARYGRENTQIAAGTTESLVVSYTPGRATRARVEVIYKLTPIMSDTEGTLLRDEWIDLER